MKSSSATGAIALSVTAVAMKTAPERLESSSGCEQDGVKLALWVAGLVC